MGVRHRSIHGERAFVLRNRFGWTPLPEQHPRFDENERGLIWVARERLRRQFVRPLQVPRDRRGYSSGVPALRMPSARRAACALNVGSS